MTFARSSLRSFFIPAIVAFSLILPAIVNAGDLVVTRYFSGLWDQTNQENQGIVLQIVDSVPEGKKAVGYWFTYGDDLESAWFIGIGQVEGPQVLLELYSVSGIAFMEDDQPDIDNVESVGSLILSFKNCNHGTAAWDLGDVGSGEFDIHKLAGLYNSRCSGGISDDTPSNAKPVQLEVALEPAREGIDGKGKAKFWERVDRSDFHVSAEDIADGDYDIQVCEESVGMLTVSAGEGQTEFRSPEAEGKELLTFDPRDCLIELHDGEGAVLTSGEDFLAPKGHGGNDDHGGGNGHGVDEISVELDSTGLLEGAEGEAEYRNKNNSVEFEVQIEDVPAGPYDLYVDDDLKGTIEVMADDDDSLKGRIRFSDPQKDDRLLLDFDVLGKLIEISNADGVVLEKFFPEERP